MNVDSIIAALDAEIEKLDQVRALLGKHEGLGFERWPSQTA